MHQVPTVPGSLSDSVPLGSGEFIVCLSGNGFLLVLNGHGAEQAAVRVSLGELFAIRALVDSAIQSANQGGLTPSI